MSKPDSIIEVEKENPYYPVGESIKGHEFHYSKPVFDRHEGFDMVFKMQRGHGIDGRRDGLLRENLLATYSHVHAGGNLRWGESLVRAAVNFKRFGKKNT